MPKQKQTLIAFNAGEFDPATLARIDLETYDRGAEVMENILPLVQGGMSKAPGTVTDVVGVAADSFLYPFVFNRAETFVVIAEPNQFRLVQGGGVVTPNAVAPTGIAGWTDDSAAAPSGGGPPPDPGTNTGGSGGSSGGSGSGTGGGGYGGGGGGVGGDEFDKVLY